MKTISYPLRIPREIVSIAELRSKEEHIDKSTAIRQLLYEGTEDYVLELYQDGRISIGRVAKILGKSIYDVHRVIMKRRIRIGHPEELHERSVKETKRLFSS